MTGYITKSDLKEDDDTVSLKIPNKEISSIFKDAVVKYFNETVNTEIIGELINVLWLYVREKLVYGTSGLLYITVCNKPIEKYDILRLY